jgi:hypothetical protein
MGGVTDGGTRPRIELRRPVRVPPHRLLLLLLAAAAVTAGLDAALLRLGLTAPVSSVPLADSHGVLMVFGFLGTAITLERAVAIQAGTRRDGWAYAAPVLSGLGTVLLLLQLTSMPVPPGRTPAGAAWTGSMLVLLLIYRRAWQRLPSFSLLVQVLGAFAGAGGAALWGRGAEAAAIVPWWAMFLVLTILGERLDLARLAFLSRGTEPRILAVAAATVVALPVTLLAPDLGYPLLGLALGALVVDVAVHDVARHTIRSHGLPRLAAACLLTGYAWALVAALAWVVGGPALAGYRYDVVVHAITIGFALSMVVAHAPVIVPAIVRRPLPYHPAIWGVWLLLQGGLALRLLAGARQAEGAWQLGGAVDVVALSLFLATTVTLVVTASRSRAPVGSR